ncbi:3-deoxy-D-manno-octulosonic acid kinase [Alteromonas halophila]|uniref:3-deoxy-D-manno-octulosonic acid kinase n=1 Tax=Alteromonas halophila TaxID=516698 RepID=A0A918JM79_9ALTE|nr:3-deoxy-D-manno-octulosonic acid kinase [Alteromonas halophila]GGW85155.1 3-deoxy-D-manno-octulosonic acid kinase [Alteromonas halophila]
MAIKQKNNGAGHHFIYDDECISNVNPEMFDATHWQRSGNITGQAAGRGTTLFIRHHDNHWVLRHYRRGGLIGKLINDAYLYSGVDHTRSFREFSLLHGMREDELAVPAPVAAYVKRRGLFYQADIITRIIPQSRDVHAMLCQGPLTDNDWQRIGMAIADLQHHQVYHHDLNIRNIMMDTQGKVWIIDFDRCYRRAGEAWKQTPLNRLQRSLNKEKDREPHFHWQPSDWQTLLDGYHSKAP